MNKGQKLLKRAKKIIPGGNQLLSKRSEMILPEIWPTYYTKAKGCYIWDLDNKKYYDFAGMGVTACVLGYSDQDVNKSIIEGLKKGSMTTLNAIEEVELAERFLKIHKWAGMAKFCKSGGEACMVAIRIARNYANKQNIAFQRYMLFSEGDVFKNIGKVFKYYPNRKITSKVFYDVNNEFIEEYSYTIQTNNYGLVQKTILKKINHQYYS